MVLNPTLAKKALHYTDLFRRSSLKVFAENKLYAFDLPFTTNQKSSEFIATNTSSAILFFLIKFPLVIG